VVASHGSVESFPGGVVDTSDRIRDFTFMVDIQCLPQANSQEPARRVFGTFALGDVTERRRKWTPDLRNHYAPIRDADQLLIVFAGLKYATLG